jgi:hypothetical protein
LVAPLVEPEAGSPLVEGQGNNGGALAPPLCGIDQLADRLVHTQEAVGSSPTPATRSQDRPAPVNSTKTGSTIGERAHVTP